MALAAMLSAYGWMSAAFVAMPRLIYALGERGDFPRAFAAVHPRFRSPHLAILLWAVLVLGLAIYGSFIWNAILAGVARLVTYGATCVALIQLRRKRPQADRWRAPAGNLLAVIGIAYCAGLALRMNATHAAVVSRGAKNERDPQLTAKMPDHELWIGFVRDPDGNLVGLMSEVRK